VGSCCHCRAEGSKLHKMECKYRKLSFSGEPPASANTLSSGMPGSVAACKADQAGIEDRSRSSVPLSSKMHRKGGTHNMMSTSANCSPKGAVHPISCPDWSSLPTCVCVSCVRVCVCVFVCALCVCVYVGVCKHVCVSILCV
jgi:hypothetical protein